MNRLDFFKNSLDVYSYREKLLSNNIANVNTPKYKRQDLNFKNVFGSKKSEHDLEMQKTDTNHFDDIDEEIVLTNKGHIKNFEDPKEKLKMEYDKTKSRLDGNNVEVDVEMVEWTKNYVNYSVVTNQAGIYAKRTKSIIQSGRG